MATTRTNSPLTKKLPRLVPSENFANNLQPLNNDSKMSGSLTHILFETASGYGIYNVQNQDEVAGKSQALQEAIANYSQFSKMVTLASFLPFTSAAQALENANDVSEGVLNPHLKSLLDLVLPGGGKKSKGQSAVLLGVIERGLAGAIQSETGIMCDTGERALELIRGVRAHADKMIGKGMEKGDVKAAQLGLGHSYSRGKVKVGADTNKLTSVQRQPLGQHDHSSHLPF